MGVAAVRTSLLSLLVAMLALSVPAFASGQQQQAQDEGPLPPIQLAPSEFDAGYVGSEDLIEAEFRVFNPTRQPLVIDGFTTSCKCTAPIIKERVIKPGKYVIVTSTVDLRGTMGDIKKSFTLKIRGWDREFPCVIKAVMGTTIKVDPKRLKRISGQIALSATDGVPFTPIALHNEGAEFSFSPRQPDAEGKSLTWMMDYRLPNTARDTCLIIETDHPDARVVTPRLYTAAASRPELEFIRQRHEIYSVRTHTVLGVVDHGDSMEIECQIRRPNHDTPLSVEADFEGVEAEIIGVQDMPGADANPDFVTKMYTVRITCVDPEEGGILAPLYFRTTDGFETRLWMMGVSKPTEKTETSDSQG